ncbi:MAG: hypothetical protein IPG79_07610 [Saprospiraceae bacterium]|nr:hypothetical protein [Saprospiraceae bacterium]
MGEVSLTNNVSGSSNIGIGRAALYSSTTGSNNLAQGNSALYFNTTGNNNIAFGEESMHNNESGEITLPLEQRHYIPTLSVKTILQQVRKLFSIIHQQMLILLSEFRHFIRIPQGKIILAPDTDPYILILRVITI